MKSLKEKLLHSFQQRHFYYKILLPFSILSIILVCLMAGMNWYWIEDEYNQKIAEANKQFLKSASGISDSYFYGTFTSVLNQSFLDIGRTTLLERFITYGDKLKTPEFLELYQNLQNICTQNPQVTEVALYQEHSDLYLDNVRGLTYHASNMTSKSYEALQGYLAAGNTQTEGLIYYPDDSTENIVILRSIPLYSNFSNKDGFIAMKLQTHDLWKELNLSSLSGSSSFFVLSPERQLLTEKSIAPDFYELLLEQADENGLPEFFTYGNTRYRLNEIQSEYSGYHYISCVPINILNAEVRVRRQIMLMFSLFCILFGILMVQRISSHAYQPIANLRKKLDHTLSDMEIQDDFSMIEETFSFLEGKVDDVQHMLDQNNTILLYKIFMDILNKKELSDSQLLHKLELCSVRITESAYCLLLLEFDNQVFHGLPMEQQEYLLTKSASIIKDFLRENVIQSAEVQPDNRLAVLLNLNPDHYSAMEEQFALLPDYLYEQLHIHCNLAFSGSIDRLSAVSGVYAEISEYFRYSFLLDYGNIFTEELIYKLDNKTFSLTLQDYKQIENMIRHGNPDEFSGLMEHYLKIVSSGECSYQEANNILIQIYRIAFNIGKELEVFKNSDKKEQILYDFNHAADFSHSLDCICLVVQMCYESIHEEVLNADSLFIQEIVAYIQQHCREDLSLSFVAQNFHVSTGHLSRLFKSVTGKNFSAHVSNVKLEAAAEMLNREPEKSIAAVAAEFGYYTPAYFTRLFKEKYGVTPSQYRKS